MSHKFRIYDVDTKKNYSVTLSKEKCISDLYKEISKEFGLESFYLFLKSDVNHSMPLMNFSFPLEHIEVELHLIQHHHGLINQGVTCFLNSLLQSLCRVRSFVDFVFGIDVEMDSNTPENRNNVEYQPLVELQNLYLQLMFSRGDMAIKTNKFTDAFTKILERDFNFNEQQDVLEFFNVLIEYLEKIYNDHNNSKNKCPIQNIFRVKCKKTKTCQKCKKVTEIADLLNMITFSFLNKKNEEIHSLRDAFSDYLIPELLTEDNKVHCEKCGVRTDTKISTAFEEFPDVILINLMRYDRHGHRCTRVSFEEKFKLEEYLPDHKFHGEYKLFAVLLHRGTLHAGHYFCYLKRLSGWICYNDSQFSMIDNSVLRECFGDNENKEKYYLLMYVKNDIPDPCTPFIFELPQTFQDFALELYKKEVNETISIHVIFGERELSIHCNVNDNYEQVMTHICNCIGVEYKNNNYELSVSGNENFKFEKLDNSLLKKIQENKYFLLENDVKTEKAISPSVHTTTQENSSTKINQSNKSTLKQTVTQKSSADKTKLADSIQHANSAPIKISSEKVTIPSQSKMSQQPETQTSSSTNLPQVDTSDSTKADSLNELKSIIRQINSSLDNSSHESNHSLDFTTAKRLNFLIGKISDHILFHIKLILLPSKTIEFYHCEPAESSVRKLCENIIKEQSFDKSVNIALSSNFYSPTYYPKNAVLNTIFQIGPFTTRLYAFNIKDGFYVKEMKFGFKQKRTEFVEASVQTIEELKRRICEKFGLQNNLQKNLQLFLPSQSFLSNSADTAVTADNLRSITSICFKVVSEKDSSTHQP